MTSIRHLDVTDRSCSVVFPACVPPATSTFSLETTAASRNRAACAAERAERDQLVEGMCL